MAGLVVDISRYNTVTDYAKVVANTNGIILRLGYRGSSTGKLALDPTFVKNANAFVKLKAPIGVYFFTTAITTAEGIAEADFCLKELSTLGIEPSFPIAIDTEWVVAGKHTGRSDHLTQTERTDIVVAFCDRLVSKGYAPMIYASDGWFTAQLVYDRIKKYYRWGARYGKALINDKDALAGFQYTSSGSISGISGSVDLSQWYIPISTSTAKPSSSSTTTTTTTTTVKTYTAGTKISLSNAAIYANSTTSKVAALKTGTYYLWSPTVTNGRIRITNLASNVGKTSAITGWIDVSTIK